MLLHRLLTTMLVVVLAGLAIAAEEEGFRPLFDGKTLDGWKQHGGKALYTVKNGEIVGSSVPNTPNSFLCTEKEYGDFILEVEFKVHPELNSGIQIRSQVFDAERELDLEGKKKKVAADRVHGYQVESIRRSGRIQARSTTKAAGRDSWRTWPTTKRPARRSSKASGTSSASNARAIRSRPGSTASQPSI